MAENSENLVVASGGTLYVGPSETTMPEDIDDSLDGALVDCGAITPDGAVLNQSMTFNDVKSWKSFGTLRKIPITKDMNITLALEEWSTQNLEMSLGGTITDTSSGSMFTPNGPGTLDERAAVLAWTDKGYDYMVVIPKCSPSPESATVGLTKADIATLPLVLTPIQVSDDAPWYFLTSDPAAAETGSSS